MPNVLITCPKCGKERYVTKSNTTTKTFTGLCWTCHWPEHLKYVHKLKRDRPLTERPVTKRSDGYLEIALPPWHWCYPMASKSRHSVMVHRLVMAEHLGRLLQHEEIVHHVNGIREDNRLENLELRTPKTHPLSYQDAYAKGLKDGSNIRDKQLEKQIKLLQWQVKELGQALQLKMESKE